MVLAVLGSLCIPAWPGTQKNPPATASQEVGLKAAWPLNRLIAESVFCHLLHKVNGMIKIANAFNLHLSLPFFFFYASCFFFLLNLFNIFHTVYSDHDFPSFVSSQIIPSIKFSALFLSFFKKQTGFLYSYLISQNSQM